VIGSGRNSLVKEASSKVDPAMKFAIKVYKLKDCEDYSLSIFQEIWCLNKLDHPNIVKLHEVYFEGNKIYLVMDLVEGTSLYDYINNHDELEEKEIRNVVNQLLRTIKYMHSCKIVHRDVNLDNVIFNPDTCQVRVIDFGSSWYFSEEQDMKDKVATPYAIAPEVLTGSYNKECDLWGVGIIAYALFSGYLPFRGNTSSAIYKEVLWKELDFTLKPWSLIAYEGGQFIESLLDKDPERRATVDYALNHSFIKNPESHKVEYDECLLEKLLYFENSILLKKEIINLAKTKIQPHVLAKLDQTFLSLDPNWAGLIDLKQLRTGFYCIGLDLNRSYLSYSGFLAIAIDLDNDEIERTLKHFKVDEDDLDQTIDSFIRIRSHSESHLKLRNEIKDAFQEPSCSREKDLFSHLIVKDTS